MSLGSHILQLLNDSKASLDSLEVVNDQAKKPTDDLVNGNRLRNGIWKMHHSCIFSQENNAGKECRWAKLVRCGSNGSMGSLGSLGSFGNAGSFRTFENASGQQNTTWGEADQQSLHKPRRTLSPRHNNFDSRLQRDRLANKDEKTKGDRRKGFSRMTSDPDIMRIPERMLSPYKEVSSDYSSQQDLGKVRESNIEKQLSATYLISMGDIKARKSHRRGRPSRRKTIIPRQSNDPTLLQTEDSIRIFKKSGRRSNNKLHSNQSDSDSSRFDLIDNMLEPEPNPISVEEMLPDLVELDQESKGEVVEFDFDIGAPLGRKVNFSDMDTSNHSSRWSAGPALNDSSSSLSMTEKPQRRSSISTPNFNTLEQNKVWKQTQYGRNNVSCLKKSRFTSSANIHSNKPEVDLFARFVEPACANGLGNGLKKTIGFGSNGGMGKSKTSLSSSTKAMLLRDMMGN